MSEADRLDAIVADIAGVIDEMIAGAALQTLSRVGYDKRLRHIRDLCKSIRDAGVAEGWNSHAVLVRERLEQLSEIGLTDEQFRNLPVPELEPW